MAANPHSFRVLVFWLPLLGLSIWRWLKGHLLLNQIALFTFLLFDLSFFFNHSNRFLLRHVSFGAHLFLSFYVFKFTLALFSFHLGRYFIIMNWVQLHPWVIAAKPTAVQLYYLLFREYYFVSKVKPLSTLCGLWRPSTLGIFSLPSTFEPVVNWSSIRLYHWPSYRGVEC